MRGTVINLSEPARERLTALGQPSARIFRHGDWQRTGLAHVLEQGRLDQLIFDGSHCRLPSTQMSPARSRSRSANRVATSQVRRLAFSTASTALRDPERRPPAD
jgi:hypothetical protein